MTKSTGRGRGFKAMTPEQRRAAARKGGLAAQRTGAVSTRFSGARARELGRKGGAARRKPKARP